VNQSFTPFRSAWRRRRPLTQIVLHETAAPPGSVGRLINYFNQPHKMLGVHIVVDGGAHAHLLTSPDLAVAHADGGKASTTHNDSSLGVEFMHAYYPDGKGQVIDAPWAHKGKYLLPSLQRLEALFAAVDYACTAFGVPKIYPMHLSAGGRWGRARGHEEASGIMAHARWNHADGLFQEAYCRLRHAGLIAPVAYSVAISAAIKGWG